eukprot:EG_transcript_25856
MPGLLSILAFSLLLTPVAAGWDSAVWLGLGLGLGLGMTFVCTILQFMFLYAWRHGALKRCGVEQFLNRNSEKIIWWLGGPDLRKGWRGLLIRFIKYWHPRRAELTGLKVVEEIEPQPFMDPMVIPMQYPLQAPTQFPMQLSMQYPLQAPTQYPMLSTLQFSITDATLQYPSQAPLPIYTGMPAGMSFMQTSPTLAAPAPTPTLFGTAL